MKTLSRAKCIVIIIFIASGLCLPATRMSLAQEPTVEPTPTPAPTSPDGIKVRDITWEDLGYGDRKLSRGSPYAWTYFYVPGDLVFVPGSYIKLLVSHTGGQTGKPAALTVELNYHVLGIVQLTAENDNRSQFQFDIPPEYLKVGRNRLRITLRTAGNACYQTDEYQANELTVEAVLHSEGLLHLEYKVTVREPDLSLFPVPFFERKFEPNILYFVLPDSPTSNDMTVAATISAGLGRYSAGEIELRSVTASELTNEILDNYNLIAIGLPGANSLLSQLPLPLPPEQADVADNDGILEEIVSPWNPRRMILVVMGKTYEGLFKAGAALNRQIQFPSFKGQVGIVKELLAPPKDKSETLAADKTFEKLGYKDTVIYGTRPTSERFYFHLPDSWQMSDNPALKLSFTHSEILNATLSTMSVCLNGVPVGSTLLDHSNSKDGLLEVDLPSWLLKSGSNRIEVFVDMSMDENECLYWTSDQAWTVLSRNSILHLPYDPQPTELDLANLFQPFIHEPNLSDTYIVLPEKLNPLERDTLLNLAAQLGTAAGGEYLALQTGQTNDLDTDLRQSYHIIAIGQPSANSLIREVNDSLPQPFLPGSDEPAQVHNPAVIALDPQRSMGFVQLTASPWNQDKALLVITGTDSEGVTAAFDLLVNRIGKLEGNLAMIEDENLATTDTRLARANESSETLHTVQADVSVLVALAERWW